MLLVHMAHLSVSNASMEPFGYRDGWCGNWYSHVLLKGDPPGRIADDKSEAKAETSYTGNVTLNSESV